MKSLLSHFHCRVKEEEKVTKPDEKFAVGVKASEKLDVEISVSVRRPKS